MKYFRSLRIKDWIYILGLPALGFVYNSGLNIDIYTFFITLVVGAFSLAYAYSLDNYFDTDNKKSFRSKIIPPFILFSMALFTSFFLLTKTFFLVILGGILVALYCIPPIRLKRFAIIGTIINSLGFGLLILLGFVASGNLNLIGFVLSALVILIVFPLQLVHELEHSENDRKTKIETVPIKYGTRITRFLIYLFLSIIVVYTFTLFYYLNISLYLFISTIFFSVINIGILHYGKDFRVIRIYLRYISIFYGILLLFIFYLRI